MAPNSSNPGELGRYLAFGQVGVEMVFPIVLGLVLDRWLDWAPWGVALGAVLGLVLGLVRLIRLANKEEERKPPSKDGPEAK